MDNSFISGLLADFRSAFGENSGSERLFFAPGRVNLIGEHTDYNQGLVLPFAINLGTWLVIRPNNTDFYRFASASFAERKEINAGDDLALYKDHWWKYPLGVIEIFRRKGYKLPGCDFFFAGDLPHSAGLSSSASVEIVTAMAVNMISGSGFDRSMLVSIAREAENDFIGLRCGIMDMYAIAMSRAGHAIMLDCSTNLGEFVPVNLDGVSFIVGNTNRARGLADSKYNERVAECEAGFALISGFLGINHLGQLQPADLSGLQGKFEQKSVYNRLLHVAEEDERVRLSAIALKHNNFEQLGALMNASHESLKNLYEVSCHELDVMTDAARSLAFTLGSRMTGAGFGGCTLSLIRSGYENEFSQKVGEEYYKKTGRQADFYQVWPSEGVYEYYLRGNDF